MHRRLGRSFDERRPGSPKSLAPEHGTRGSHHQASPTSGQEHRTRGSHHQASPTVEPRPTLDPSSPSTSTHSSSSRHRDRVLGLVSTSVPSSKTFLPPDVNEILPFADGHPFAAWGKERETGSEVVWAETPRGKRTWGGYRGVYRVGWEREVLNLEARLHETMLEVAGNTFTQETPGTVLDLGTGLGLWPVSQALVWPDTTFVGLDIVPCQIDLGVLAQAGSTGPWEEVKDRITWVQGDFLALPFDAGVFDMVHVRFVGLGLPEGRWGDLLEEATRVLRSGGILEIVEMAYTLTATPSLVNSFASLLLSDLINPVPAMPIKFYLPIVGMSPAPVFEETWEVAPGALGEAMMVWVRSALDYKGTGIGRAPGPQATGEQSATVVAWVVRRG